jgi:hypothetical protein
VVAGPVWAQTADMNSNSSSTGEVFNLTCFGIFLVASLVLFTYQIAHFTTLLG